MIVPAGSVSNLGTLANNTLIPGQLAVRFDSGDDRASGTMKDVYLDPGVNSYTLPDCLYALEASNFVAWSVQIGEDEPVTRQPGETITLTVNARVTAVWETVSFGTPDLTLPGTLTVIEESAFEGDTAITSVDVPASSTFIGDYAFRGCTSLTMIRIPADCALGTGVFDGCEQVYIFGVAGSPAESYCGSHDNCLLVEEE